MKPVHRNVAAWNKLERKPKDITIPKSLALLFSLSHYSAYVAVPCWRQAPCFGRQAAGGALLFW